MATATMKAAVKQALAQRPSTAIGAVGKAKSIMGASKSEMGEIYKEVVRQKPSLKKSAGRKPNKKKAKRKSNPKTTKTKTTRTANPKKKTTSRKKNMPTVLKQMVESKKNAKPARKSNPAFGKDLMTNAKQIAVPTILGVGGYMVPGLLKASLEKQLVKIDFFSKNQQHIAPAISGGSLLAGIGAAIWLKDKKPVKDYAAPVLLGMGVRFALDLMGAYMPKEWGAARKIAGLSSTPIKAPVQSGTKPAPGTTQNGTTQQTGGTTKPAVNPLAGRTDVRGAIVHIEGDETHMWAYPEMEEFGPEVIEQAAEGYLVLSDTTAAGQKGAVIVDPDGVPWKIDPSTDTLVTTGHGPKAFSTAYKPAGVSGYSNFSPAMGGYSNFYPAMGGYQVGYEMSGSPQVGYEMSGGPQVGYELAGMSLYNDVDPSEPWTY